MTSKQRLVFSWATGICLVLCLFYVAVAWLWSAVAESQAAAMERGVVSALSNDLAEGNLFKFGSTISKLQHDGQLNFAEIRQFHEGRSSVIFKTSDADASAEAANISFHCGETRRIIRQSRDDVSMLTTLPISTVGLDCVTLYFTANLPLELRKLKNRILITFGTLVAMLLVFFFWITTTWFRQILDLEYAKSAIQLEKESEIGRMASQVAHDIRSPLAALEVVSGDMEHLPEDKRIMLHSAVGRIRDIANSLLARNKALIDGTQIPEASHTARTDTSPQLLSSLIESIVTEKRLQFRSLSRIEIRACLDAASYGVFAQIGPVDFKRLLSNLINNAVESFGDESGIVSVSVSARDRRAFVTVQDNGKGIPPGILPNLGRRGETHGKPGGSGLGLHHARTSAESWGGSLDIASEVDKGTTITIALPQAPAPDWFVSELTLIPGKAVVVLDDDASIHQVWQGRLDALRARGHLIEIVHASTPGEIRSWVERNDGKAREALYLLDYELLGYRETGLSLAEELTIGERTVLVTSRYEESAVLEGCRKVKSRMIPKGLAGLVPIRVEKSAPAPDTAETRWDVVLIDDDPLARMTWKMAAELAGKKLQAFSTVADFMKESDTIDRRTPVYVDAELADGVKGGSESLKIHDFGFSEIYLATGHAPEKFTGLTHLRGVVGKTPPWSIKG